MKNKCTLSGLTVANFGKLIDGKETKFCIHTNKKGTVLTITNYGAKIVSLMVPDQTTGKLTDVVTGQSGISIKEYDHTYIFNKVEKDSHSVLVAFRYN